MSLKACKKPSIKSIGYSKEWEMIWVNSYKWLFNSLRKKRLFYEPRCTVWYKRFSSCDPLLLRLIMPTYILLSKPKIAFMNSWVKLNTFYAVLFTVCSAAGSVHFKKLHPLLRRSGYYRRGGLFVFKAFSFQRSHT